MRAKIFLSQMAENGVTPTTVCNTSKMYEMWEMKGQDRGWCDFLMRQFSQEAEGKKNLAGLDYVLPSF